MRIPAKSGQAILLGSLALLSATLPVAAKDQSVTINFGLLADGKEVGCGAPLPNLGSGRLLTKLHDARFYVHDVKLIDARGVRVPVSLARNDWQYGNLALLDFKDARGGNAPCTAANPAKNTTVKGTIPSGNYVGLEFVVGVPLEATVGRKKISFNHSSTETSEPPLDIAAMAWNWQGGRKFLLIEVDPPPYVLKPDGSKALSWMVHLGSTGCKGNPATGEMAACGRANRFTVTFDRFDRKNQRVYLDLSKLFQNTDLLVDKGGAIGCMSAPDDPDCPAIFEQIGLNLVETAPGAGDAGMQRRPGMSPVFSVGSATLEKLANEKK